MTATTESVKPAVAAIVARLARNRASLAARLRRVDRERLRVAPERVAIVVAGCVALVVLVALALDPVVAGLPGSLPRPVEAFFQRATRFGKSDWLLIPSAAVVIAVALGDWRRVGRIVAAAWGEIAALAAVLFLAVAASGLAADILKPIVGRSRPHFADGSVFEFTPFYLGGYAHYSFPSGHATTMAAVAVIIMATAAGRGRTILLVAAGIVAASRVMLGVHYPADVVAGMLLGGGISWLILRFMAEARIGFALQADGSIRRRAIALRALRRRKSLAMLLPSLWVALFRRD